MRKQKELRAMKRNRAKEWKKRSTHSIRSFQGCNLSSSMLFSLLILSSILSILYCDACTAHTHTHTSMHARPNTNMHIYIYIYDVKFFFSILVRVLPCSFYPYASCFRRARTTHTFFRTTADTDASFSYSFSFFLFRLLETDSRLISFAIVNVCMFLWVIVFVVLYFVLFCKLMWLTSSHLTNERKKIMEENTRNCPRGFRVSASVYVVRLSLPAIEPFWYLRALHVPFLWYHKHTHILFQSGKRIIFLWCMLWCVRKKLFIAL